MKLQVKWMSEVGSDAWTFKHKTIKVRTNNFNKLFPNFKPKP